MLSHGAKTRGILSLMLWDHAMHSHTLFKWIGQQMHEASDVLFTFVVVASSVHQCSLNTSQKMVNKAMSWCDGKMLIHMHPLWLLFLMWVSTRTGFFLNDDKANQWLQFGPLLTHLDLFNGNVALAQPHGFWCLCSLGLSLMRKTKNHFWLAS